MEWIFNPPVAVEQDKYGSANFEEYSVSLDLAPRNEPPIKREWEEFTNVLEPAAPGLTKSYISQF